jgi:putative SOS response-associated peptidase YedK
MCGRFTQERSDTELADIFEAEPLSDDPGGRYNVAPTDPASVVVERDGRRAIRTYRWGLVPHWATNASGAARHINAREETILTSGAFRESFARRRCIVPADGFYEWRKDGGRRQPYLIHRPDGVPLGLAGLWSGWREPESGTVRRTFTIVTTAANAAMAPLHDRMPVVLAPDAWARWLDPNAPDLGELRALLRPAPDEWLEIYPVEPLVNNVRNNGPALVRRLEGGLEPSAPAGTLGL